MDLIKNSAWQSCVAIFILHQISQKFLNIQIPFIDSFLDPLLCLPIFMGFMLAERRLILSRYRSGSVYTYSVLDTIVIAVTLSIIFEELFPIFSKKFTKDNFDYIFYGIGALIFYYFINIPKNL